MLGSCLAALLKGRHELQLQMLGLPESPSGGRRSGLSLAAAPERKRVIKEQLPAAGAAAWGLRSAQREGGKRCWGSNHGFCIFQQDGTSGCSELLATLSEIRGVTSARLGHGGDLQLPGSVWCSQDPIPCVDNSSKPW